MTARVFLAYPLTSGAHLASLEVFEGLLRKRLSHDGWDVLPIEGGPERVTQSADRATSVTRLSSNVVGVTRSDALVLLVPELREPSSIWVEFGMALAAGGAVIIVGPAEAKLPYLACLALEAGAADPTGEWQVSRVVAELPPRSDPGPLIAAISHALSHRANS